ncbi:aminotransferase class IV family protein [Lysobacter sp. K5869]|uniref:aminotransferase class IV family protein n=1 Tax=Lysobacter sp. K5869 TaxID=2820808 RepID=UPI001C05F7BD|nr:aminotransferase class IV family protein [Lysobacter sp. K5869]QWP75824.1 aminotransferase class IV family protein [Lysobacter sp. K5869]
MSASLSVPAAEFAAIARIDGRDADAAALAPLAFAGHAHFTAMQVRDGRVRGLDLHLRRLREASLELYGRAVPDETVLAYLREALRRSPADLSLTATVFQPAGEFAAGDAVAMPSVLVRTAPPSDGPRRPLALTAVEHERTLPHRKHVGEIAKTYHLRRALEQGYDDAAFLDRHGRFSEATIWNLAFWDGEAVVWPQAEMLIGTTQGIVRRQLERAGVAQRERALTPADLPALRGAAVMNSWTPGVAVRRIGATALPEAPEFLQALHRAFAAEPASAP